MHHTTKKYSYIFIFLFGQFLISPLLASNADSLFAIKEYQMAALEYERIIFHSSNGQEINNALYKKAQCYKIMGDYNRSLAELNKVTYWNIPDSSAQIFRFETAVCNYLCANFKEAEFQLDLLENIPNNNIDQSLKILLKVFIYNETRQWEKAHATARQYVGIKFQGEAADSLNIVLSKAYSKKNLPKYKSEKKANVLRMLPGLGQAYMGKVGEGAFNFLLNLSFLSFGVYHIYYGYYITGYFVGAIGLSKVYFGGHARTSKLLQQHNYNVHRKFCGSIKQILTKKAG